MFIGKNEEEILRPWRYPVMTEDPDDAWLGRQDQNGTAVVKGRPNITRAQIMEVFDCLPKSVRVGLANSNHAWAPHWAKGALGYAKIVLERPPAKVIVERIERADREEVLKRELQLIAGKG